MTLASASWIRRLVEQGGPSIQERLDIMGDRLHLLPHTRAEWLLAGYPKIAPSPENKGKWKGTRRMRKEARQ